MNFVWNEKKKKEERIKFITLAQQKEKGEFGVPNLQNMNKNKEKLSKMYKLLQKSNIVTNKAIEKYEKELEIDISTEDWKKFFG